ncbi:MAG: spermidine synthase [Porticoccaceae bacterium]|nr:spermidine synthase [Porticoccaceae bacterium]
MTLIFEELDHQPTPLGDISLRRRSEPRLNGEVLYEVKLGDEFLMSSLFTAAEIELSHLGLAELAGTELDVIVGGLGLGYTALTALENPAVKRLTVIEILQPVIDWHERGLVPVGPQLTADSRCELRQADFFAVAANPASGFHPDAPNRQVNAVLLDIDHAPDHWLNPQNSSFYTEASLQILHGKIKPGGVFGLWSNELPSEQFTAILQSVFQRVTTHVVTFPNPYSGGESSNSVYLAYT